jgi:hypothetical protein
VTNQPPVICFGQQPCGIFPKRFFVAKVLTARRLQKELGGEIVYFCHDSDHDPRETRTMLHHRKNGEPFEINFTFENKLQRKYSPLFLKRVMPDWHAKTAMQLPAYVDRPLVELFKSIPLTNVADFCLAMYRGMGLLDGVRVVRSGDPEFRRSACDITDFFVDVTHEGEIVRARCVDGKLMLHEGGAAFITLPPCQYSKEQISPTRDSRLPWMQSVVHCTHYVAGASEQDYLHKEDAPEINYLKRDTIEHSDDAWTQITT